MSYTLTLTIEEGADRPVAIHALYLASTDYRRRASDYSITNPFHGELMKSADRALKMAQRLEATRWVKVLDTQESIG